MFIKRFRIEEDQHIGRYLTSRKDFEPGDIVWQELPLISVPSDRYEAPLDDPFLFTCVGCFKNITNDQMKCPRCSWPCCSLICSESEYHKKYECPIFVRRSIPVSSEAFKKLIFIRFALYKDLEPDKYKRLLLLCSEYDVVDSDYEMSLNISELSLHTFLNIECNLDVSESEVSKMLTIFRTNNFHILFAVNHFTDFSGQAVYEYSSLFSHGCSPNLEYSFGKVVLSNGNICWKVVFHARRAIRIGEILSISYGSELQFGTVPRQLEILENRRFICKCNRCSDRTEEGTYLSALVCTYCRKGHLLLLRPMEATASPWLCDSCPCLKSAECVETLIQKLSVIPMTLYDIYSPNEESVTMADTFIEQHSGTSLHPNHYLLLQCALHWLCESAFPSTLAKDTEEADNLFSKIMMRLRRYTPLAVKFAKSEVNAQLHFVSAQVLAVYIFQSVDMVTIIRSDILPLYQIKVCREILQNLQSSLFWERMKPNGLNFQKIVARLSRLVAVWSDHLEKMVGDHDLLEETTLESIPNLFS